MPSLPALHNCNIAVIGLGYVGFPLAVEFALCETCMLTNSPLKRQVIAFDIDEQRLDELRNGYDRTNEISSKIFKDLVSISLTSNPADLLNADVFIITVPTPVDSSKTPDLSPLKSATATVGSVLKARRDYYSQNNTEISTPIIIYESTVYPGATEEVCVPILESLSGLVFNTGFFCGYSPERINPGDNTHKLSSITKVTSGSTAASSDWINQLYGSIIAAGTHKAPSLKVAEAAKVIENTQRDLNIALINELAIIFSYMNIDTLDVLDAASTKWNFLPFRPGLVGGHCIGVDPYYLTYKAQQLGYYPDVVLAGRRINDGMATWIADRIVLELARRGAIISSSKVLVLGLTFKENCPDLRNTRVVDLIHSLERFGMQISVVDPCVDPKEAHSLYGISVISRIPLDVSFASIIVAVPHQEFVEFDISIWESMSRNGSLLFDLKGIIPRSINALRI